MEKEEKDFLVSFITDQRKQVRGSFLDTRRFIDTIVGGVFILSFIQGILGKPSLINKIFSGIFLLNFIISMIGQRFAEKQLEHLLKDWDAALTAVLHDRPMEAEPIAWKAKAVDSINAVTFWVFILALIGYALVNLL